MLSCAAIRSGNSFLCFSDKPGFFSKARIDRRRFLDSNIAIELGFIINFLQPMIKATLDHIGIVHPINGP